MFRDLLSKTLLSDPWLLNGWRSNEYYGTEIALDQVLQIERNDEMKYTQILGNNKED